MGYRTMKRAILFLVCLVSVAWASAQDVEKAQMSPHTVHVGAGYSSIASGVYLVGVSGVDVSRLKRGAGLEAAYSYLPAGKRLGFGVCCTSYLVRATISSKDFGDQPWVFLNMQIHNLCPTVNYCWVGEKHALKAELGVGYMYAQIGGTTASNQKDVKSGVSSYLAWEYEYRIDEYTGLFVRLHNMTWIDEWDEEEKVLEGIEKNGVSIGFNLHF